MCNGRRRIYRCSATSTSSDHSSMNRDWKAETPPCWPCQGRGKCWNHVGSVADLELRLRLDNRQRHRHQLFTCAIPMYVSKVRSTLDRIIKCRFMNKVPVISCCDYMRLNSSVAGRPSGPVSALTDMVLCMIICYIL